MENGARRRKRSADVHSELVSHRSRRAADGGRGTYTVTGRWQLNDRSRIISQAGGEL